MPEKYLHNKSEVGICGHILSWALTNNKFIIQELELAHINWPLLLLRSH